MNTSKNPFSAAELAKAIVNQNANSRSTKKARQKRREAKMLWDETKYYTKDGRNVTEYIKSGKTAYYKTKLEAIEHKAKFGGYYVKIYKQGKNKKNEIIYKKVGYGCPR